MSSPPDVDARLYELGRKIARDVTEELRREAIACSCHDGLDCKPDHDEHHYDCRAYEWRSRARGTR